MTDKRNNLDRLFADARTEPPVVTFQETRARVEAQVTVGGHGILKTFTQTNIVMITTGISLFTAALIGFLSWNSTAGSEEHGGVAKGKIDPIAQGNESAQKGITAGTAANLLPPKSNGTDGPIIMGTNEKEKGRTLLHQGGGEKDNDGMFTSPAPFISAIRMLELTQEELGRLGLQPDTAGVWCFFTEGGVNGFGITMYGFVQAPDPNQARKEGVAAPAFYPAFITDDLGNRRISMRDDNDPAAKAQQEAFEELDRKVQEGNLSSDEISALYDALIEQGKAADMETLSSGKLVPILVRTGHSYTDADKANRHWRPDCIFWYQPTPEFLAALPERMRLPLERELRLSSVLQGKPDNESMDAFLNRQPMAIRRAFDSLQSKPTENSVAAVAGERILGTFGAASGAITASVVAPNPARDRVVLRYTLAASRPVALSLYDVRGALVKTIDEPASQDAGDHVQMIDLKGVQPGMYMLVISTGKEKAVQRVIVE